LRQKPGVSFTVGTRRLRSTIGQHGLVQSPETIGKRLRRKLPTYQRLLIVDGIISNGRKALEMPPLEYLISAAVTLFVVVDPIGLAPTFLSVTTGFPDVARRDVALRAAAIAGAILVGTALIGDWLLRQLGITLPAFRIAGGLLLFSIASEMVLG